MARALRSQILHGVSWSFAERAESTDVGLAISVILAILYGRIVTAVIAYFSNSYHTGKLPKYPMHEQIRDVLPVLGPSYVMGGGVYAVGPIPSRSQIVRPALQILAGAALCTALCLVFKVPSFREILDAVKPRLLRFSGANAKA